MGLAASQSRLLSLTARLSDLELQAQSISNAKIRLADLSAAASKTYSDALNKETMKVYTGLQSNGTSTYIDATAKNLTTYGMISSTDKQRFIKDSSNKVIVTKAVGQAYDSANGSSDAFLDSVVGYHDQASATSAGKTFDSGAITYNTNVFNEIKESGGWNNPGDTNLNDKDWLSRQIDNGNIFLYEYDPTGGSAGTGDYTNVSWTSGDATLQEVSDNTQTAKAEATYETTMASIQAKDKRFDMNLTTIDTEHTAIQTEIDSVKKVIDKNIERSFKIFNA